jgi:hypothetical protein
MRRKLLTAKIAEKGRDEHKKSRQRVGFAIFPGFLCVLCRQVLFI